MAADAHAITRRVQDLGDDQYLTELTWTDSEGDPASGADTGETVVLTGYVPVADDDILATDTVNEALAKLAARVQALEDAP